MPALWNPWSLRTGSTFEACTPPEGCDGEQVAPGSWTQVKLDDLCWCLGKSCLIYLPLHSGALWWDPDLIMFYFKENFPEEGTFEDEEISWAEKEVEIFR